jgi:hypothetical protein
MVGLRHLARADCAKAFHVEAMTPSHFGGGGEALHVELVGSRHLAEGGGDNALRAAASHWRDPNVGVVDAVR